MIISANITAYSTAVGPSSETRKRCTFKARLFIASLRGMAPRALAHERPLHHKKIESARHSDSHKPPACLAPERDSNFKCSPRHLQIAYRSAITLATKAAIAIHPFGSQAAASDKSPSAL